MDDQPTRKFVACAGKGFRWKRGRTGSPRMVKERCRWCDGRGKIKLPQAEAYSHG